MKIYSSLVIACVILWAACKKESDKPTQPTPIPKDTLINQTPPKDTVKVKDSLPIGLIAYYPFNQNANDESGNKYHGMNEGATLTQNRFNEPDKAFSFDGINAWIKLPKLTLADSIKDLTISIWFKAEGADDNYLLSFLPKDSGSFCSTSYSCLHESTGYSTWHSMVTDYTNSNCTKAILHEPIANPVGKWTHLVIVQHYDEQNKFMPQFLYYEYLNGKKLDGHSGASNNPSLTSLNHGGSIGSNINGHGVFYNFKGEIDDIRIYNRILSDHEVEQLNKLPY